jgi:hypothetical protein
MLRLQLNQGHPVAQMVDALHYKPIPDDVTGIFH